MRHDLPFRLSAPCCPGAGQKRQLRKVMLGFGLLILSLPASGQTDLAADDEINPLDLPLLPPLRSAAPVTAPSTSTGSTVNASRSDQLAEQRLTALAAEGDPLDGEIRDRLLKVPGGNVLRVSSRKVDGAWEIRRDGRWITLPVGMVGSTRLEHRVIRELHERQKELRRGDNEGLLELVRWELDEGLYEEGLAAMNRILAENPDDTGVLLLMARPSLPFALPRASLDPATTRRDLLDYGGQAPRALQELVIRRLSQDADREALEQALTLHLRSSRPRDREFAALAARRLFPEGIALKELLRRTLLDPHPDVRTSAALALRDTGEEGLTLPLIRGLESKSSVLRTHAARSLGQMGFAAAVEPLASRLATLKSSGGGDGWRAPAANVFIGRQVSFVQGFDTEIATAAVIAKPIIGIAQTGATLDVRVQGISGGTGGAGGALSYSYNTETKALRRALARITGADVRDTNSAWREWWETYGADFVAKHLADRPIAGGSLVGKGAR